jgi:hypothetical protein
MTPGIRKTALIAHITCSVGWLGAVTGFEALAITGVASSELLMVRSVYLAMEPIVWFVIVPFAFASLLTGLTMALGTKWGVFRHYWILAKFLINVLAISLLFTHARLISVVATAAAKGSLLTENLGLLRIKLVAVGGAALVALLVATTLAVFKPRGITPYGQRKQQYERQEIPGRAPVVVLGNPVKSRRLAEKIFIAVIGALVLGLAALHLTGVGFGHHH